MAEPSSHLVVGLGNIGDECTDTRHNIGFRVLDALVRKRGAEFLAKRRLTSAVAVAKDAGGKLILAKPLTYMNRSGLAVAAIVGSEGVALKRLLVVLDDADLELGRLRLRSSGSSGGHRGLESIIAVLGSDEFARLQVGVGGGGRGEKQLADYVLAKFSREEQKTVKEATTGAVEAIECWRREGLEKAMNQFNVKQ